jgi:hypothetical protein
MNKPATTSILFTVDNVNPSDVEFAVDVLAGVLDLAGWDYVATMYVGSPIAEEL